MTQDSIKAILLQLQEDLIEEVRKIPSSSEEIGHVSPHETGAESSIETAIKRCVKSALEKCAAESNAESMSQAEASKSSIAGTTYSYPSSLGGAAKRSPSVSSDLFNTILPPMPDTLPELLESHMDDDLDLPQRDSTNRRRVDTDSEGFKVYKKVLQRLYMKERRPLNEVMSYMAKVHNFRPT